MPANSRWDLIRRLRVNLIWSVMLLLVKRHAATINYFFRSRNCSL